MAQPVPESAVLEVVEETSERMKDPSYAELAVGNFVETQPEISRFLSARASKLGGAQGMLEVVFHAELAQECLRRHRSKELAPVPLGTLDLASQGDPVGRLGEREPALASYIASNVEDAGVRTELCRVVLALSLSR